MEHSYHHIPAIPSQRIKTAFLVGISLNFFVVIIEVVAGLMVNSLSLLSDAFHNLADVGILALSLFAYKLIAKGSNEQYTYGYSKTSILVALFNAIFLMVSIGAIAFEACQRLLHPQPLQGKVIAIVAGLGILINFFTALLFIRDKNKDLNVKSAYLHLMNDAGISFGIVVGGVIILFTSWYWIDSLLSIIISIIILISTWQLLRDSFRLSMDGVPRNINIPQIQESVMKIPGVKDLHHIHIWGISTAENALTAHLVLDQSVSPEEEKKIKTETKNILEQLGIHHITLETERVNDFHIKSEK
jgi:cobalt-zinc-cadmium efflux system protein